MQQNHSNPASQHNTKRLVLVVIPTMENAYHNLQSFVAIQPPMGLASIAASVETGGREAVIIDGDAESLSIDQTIERVVALRPDYLGATIMTATVDITGEFFSKLKKRLPEVPVIVGGPHVSALPEQTLLDIPQVDISIIGEGDESIGEILAALDKGDDLAPIAGIAYRDQAGEVLTTEPREPIRELHKLPIPAFHLLNKDLYRSYGWNGWVNGLRSPFGVVFTGRGCVGKCNFCAAHSVFGRGVRYFSLEQIKAQIDFLVETWQVRILHFLDDTFTANRKMVEQICDYLIEKNYHQRVEAMVSSRVDTVSPKTLKKMRRAGIRWICFGVESGNQEILSRMHKNIRIEQVHRAFRLAREADLYIVGNFMLGHIGETEASALDTINLACELDQDYTSFAIAIPLPGTELYHHCLTNNITLPSWNDFGNVNSPPISLNPGLSPEDLMRLRDLSTNRFFKRPGYFFGLLKRFNALQILRDFSSMYLAIRREKRAKRL